MMRNKTSGLTIIEMLVVIAIIGILAALSIPNILRSRDVSRLRDIQSAVIKDIEKAKSLNRRHSYDYTLSFNTTTNSYSFAPPSGASSESATITGKLPSDAKISSIPESVTLKAPFGRIDATSAASGGTGTKSWVEIELIGKSIKTGIDIIGVTGIVVKRGIQ
jgi:prepilin-type N-terminal cleavage/methylation domain-containing protein